MFRWFKYLLAVSVLLLGALEAPDRFLFMVNIENRFIKSIVELSHSISLDYGQKLHSFARVKNGQIVKYELPYSCDIFIGNPVTIPWFIRFWNKTRGLFDDPKKEYVEVQELQITENGVIIEKD